MLIFYQIFRRSTLYQSQVVTLGVHYRNTVLFYSFFTWGEKQQNEKKKTLLDNKHMQKNSGMRDSLRGTKKGSGYSGQRSSFFKGVSRTDTD